MFFRGKKSQMNHLLRGKKSEMNHLLRGKKSQVNHLLRGKKSQMNHLLRGKKETAVNHFLRGRRAGAFKPMGRYASTMFTNLAKTLKSVFYRTMRGEFNHLMRGKKSDPAVDFDEDGDYFDNDLYDSQDASISGGSGISSEEEMSYLNEEPASSEEAEGVGHGEEEQSYIFY